MPTNDNHDLGRDTLGNTQPSTERREESPGYETTDVNVGGVVVFLAGLAGFLVVFFVFCFVMGKVINRAFLKEDGPVDKWHQEQDRGTAGGSSAGGTRENLANNPEMQQRQLQQMTSTFPTPRLEIDDGNQSVADLHSKEDLLLNNYSSYPADNGSIRIPIARAMELIAERGLPVIGTLPAEGAPQMAGEARPDVPRPLTDGFARTGYELDVLEARAQRLSYGKASEGEHAELKPAH